MHGLLFGLNLVSVCCALGDEEEAEVVVVMEGPKKVHSFKDVVYSL